MQPKEHANLLAILSWVYAGLQTLTFLILLTYLLAMGGLAVFTAAQGRTEDAFAIVFWIVIIVLLAVLSAVGLASLIANIRLGRKLRGRFPPTQRTVIVTAILNFLSFLCGGIMLLPFGTALGVYGLWFALSETGKSFLSGQPYAPQFGYQQAPQPAQLSTYDNSPYKWQ